MKNIILFIGIYGAFIFINTLVFCILFNMHPSDPDYFFNHMYLRNINLLLLLPTFFIIKHINKNEQIVF